MIAPNGVASDYLPSYINLSFSLTCLDIIIPELTVVFFISVLFKCIFSHYTANPPVCSHILWKHSHCRLKWNTYSEMALIHAYIYWEEKRDRKQPEFKVCVWKGADVPALLILRAQEEGEWDPARADFSLHLSSPPPHSFISCTYSVQHPEACCRCECNHLQHYRWAVTQARCAALQSLNCGSCEVKANINYYIVVAISVSTHLGKVKKVKLYRIVYEL